MRRVGAHEVILPEQTLHQAVVEIQDDRVVNYFEFRDELPMTEWLGGTIQIFKNADGVLQAYHENQLLTAGD